MTSDDIRSILKVQEQIRIHLLPYTQALQTIVENQHMTQINQDIVRLNEITRAAFGPVQELSRRASYMYSIVESIEEFKIIQNLVQVFNDRFYLPDVTSAIHLLQQFDDSTVSKVLERYRLQMSEIHHSFETVSKSWLDRENNLQSLDGFVTLKGIGHALNTMRPFELGLTEALRIDLGDWRSDINWPTDVIANPVARTSFYEARGLNPNITAFPSSTFDELVVSSGIREPSTDHYDDGYLDVQQEHEERDIAFKRTNEAHDRIQRFETQIREFIVKRMNDKFGTNWIKHRISGDMKNQWNEKQKKAKDNRDIVWSLIAYADFADYVEIITRKDNWQEIFQEVFVRKSSVQESFQRLFPIRMCTMHSRFITQDDELYLFVETKRILKAIRKFKE